MSQPLSRIESSFVAVPTDNIDTDQICPARFLTSTSRQGFGPALFADWRYDGSGAPRPAFPLNQPEAKGARILVTGRNFGCGSSREHAVWALRDNGIQAVIAPSVADIFKRNALKNGVLPVVIEEAAHAMILARPASRLLPSLSSSTLPFSRRLKKLFKKNAFLSYGKNGHIAVLYLCIIIHS